LSTIWSGVWLFLATPFSATPFVATPFLTTPRADVLAVAAVAAIAVLAVLAAGVLLRAAALGGTAVTPVAVGAHPARAAHGVHRLCDPDAAGRPRPRAPAANPAA
jgi:hypothetical protein